MVRFLIAGLGGGVILILLDFVLNANPLARRLGEPYAPIARRELRLAAPLAIDLCYGLALAGLYLLLRPALPGGRGVGAGVVFGLVAWFLRSVMGALSQGVMFAIPWRTHLYAIGAGLIEMLALGLIYGVAL